MDVYVRVYVECCMERALPSVLNNQVRRLKTDRLLECLNRLQGVIEYTTQEGFEVAILRR